MLAKQCLLRHSAHSRRLDIHAKGLKALEIENARLKRLLAESVLENEITKEALRESGDRIGSTRPGAVDAGQGATRPSLLKASEIAE